MKQEDKTMRDKVKRFISILMTALMLVNLLPVGALADGIASGGYQQATVANYNGIVYVYVKVTGNTDGLVLNKDGWYTIGTVSIANMPDPSSYRYSSYGEHVDYVWSTGWFSNKIYASSVSGINHERNKTIPLEKVKWTGTVGDQSFGFIRVDSGATDYPNASKYTWHLDGYVNVEDVQAEYTVRYVDQDTGIVLQTAAIGKGKLGSTISHNAPDTVAYNGKDYTRQVAQTQTFKLVSPTNTFDIDYRRPYGYTVEYYYDGVKDDKKTETGSAWCKDVIEEYIDKTPDGYEHEKTENLPLTIKADESKNVIKVYYKKIGYTVTYEPGELGTFKAKAYNAKHGDATPAFDGETTGKPGWTFAGWEPAVADTVTENATYTAVFVPDETKKATVLYTISLGQSDYGSIAPSAQQIILQATGKLDSDGGSVSGSTATAKTGYKFAGWYKATGEATYEKVTDDPKLTSELAESTLNRDKETGLYQNTVFEARFEPDEKQTATVTYTAENGTVTHASDTILQADASGLTGSTATPNPGYKFDGWYKGDERITTDLTLTPEKAKDKLDKDENGLYVNTTFTAKCVLDEDQNATVLCTIDKTQIGYGTVYPSIYQTILQATGKQANGDPISGSMATANPGYKFVGWYKVTGEETYEKVTDDPELTSELAESKLNRDEKTGLYRNTVFVARFELDAGAKVPVTYEAENGTLEGTTSQEAQVVTGEGLTDVEATPNKGYKFDGWYVVDKNGDEHLISGLDPAEKLDAETAKKYLNKDGNLYAETTFIARFVPDTKQNVEVIYTTDGNGDLDKSHYMVKQHVQIVTGEVVRENGSVIGPKLTTVRANAPSEGYEFDHWVKVIGENNLQRINGAKFELEDAQARPLLNKAADGLYQKTEFRAIFKPRTDLSYTVNYYWNGTEIPVKPSKTVLHQTFGEEVTESPIGADDYTPLSNEPKKIKIGADSTQNVITFYYYRNVKLTANSDTKTYNGKNQSVSGYTCAVAEMKNGRLEYVPWTGEKPLIFDGISASGSGKDVNEKGYQVTFNESPIGEHDDLYYVKESQTGILMITPAPVTLQAPIASKTYDGTPLKAEDYGHSFVEGLDFADDFASISVEGSQTLVGSSASSVTYELKQGKIPNNYNIQCIPGTLTITPVMDEVLVKIKGNTANVTYDGTPHEVEGYVASSISNPLYTANDFTYNGVAKAEGTDAATYPMNLAETRFENTNTNFKNVRFEVVTDGSLTISKRNVTLTSADLTKVYDGTALTNGNTPVKEEFGTEKAFPDGEGLDYTFTGSQTVVGSSDNKFTYKPNTNTKLTNYEITKTEGTLEVTPVTDKVTVTIKGGKSSVTYNGEDHTVTGYKVADISNPLYKEANFTFSGKAEANGKNAGIYKMGLKAADFANTSNNFTNVEFVVADGQLEITKRPVTLTSATLIKDYDGTPLTNGDTPVTETFGTEKAFPDGEGVTYTFKGSQTNAGSSKNMFTYAWNEGTNKDNYTIYQIEGDLVVTPIDGIKVTITGRKDTQTYDGKPHKVEGYDVKPDNPLFTEKDIEFNGEAEATGTDVRIDPYQMGLKPEQFTNTSNNFTNVEFVVEDGQIVITPRPVTLTSETASKTYDGTPLTRPNVTVSTGENEGFVEGEVTEIKATGSVTNAGSVANTITFTPNKETFKNGNYAITKTEGTLTIAKRSVLITSQSATKTYDGSALTRPAVTITGDGFVPGELAKAEATGSITNVGSTPNTIQYTTTGAFNAANYSIALSVGTLTVTEKPKPEPRRTFNLTINYVYQNGKRAAASYNRGGLKNGETFDITSPVIAGYTASETVVSGTIYNRDIKVTVIYTADGVNLDDYGVPLGLGNITMNVGDCFE